MLTLKQISFISALIFALLSTAIAQESISPQGSSLTITAAAIAGERVRIAAPAAVVQLRVEVYTVDGEKLFDQEIRGGNVFDWHLQNGQGQRLAPGNYVCVVTAKSVSGKLTHKIGTVRVEEKSVSVQPTQSLSVAQAQTIGPVEENSSWMITGKDEPQTPTVIAHDGTDGQMIRGRGALTFRVGNFFTGNDREQMRLTEDGRLGIGISEPKTTLDVAGTIRAQRFLVVKPKPTDAGKSAQEYLTANATEPEEALITGTGTQDRIAKWIDNSATLGDSSITEIGGNVGIGTTSPGSRLVVSSNSSTLPPASGVARFAEADGVQTAVFADAFGTSPIFNVRRANGTAAAPSAVQANQLLGVIGASAYGASTYSGTRARVGFFASQNWTDAANGTYLTFNTTANGAATGGGTERLRIDSAGNVGIGTTAPGSRLDVAGTVNSSEQYNIRGNRVLTISGDENRNTFVGAQAGRPTLPISGINNSFFGLASGQNTDSGSSNTFLGALAGQSNNSGSFNTFVGASTGGNTFPSAGDNNTLLGYNAGFGFATNLNHATAIGAGAFVDSNNTIVLGRSSGDDTVVIPGKLQIDTLAAAGSTELCLNDNNRVGQCSASSLRYKKAVLPFASGLKIVNRLQPIMFPWKHDGRRDLGLAAEDVALVEPMLTFNNQQGEIEGIKYSRVNLVLINAVKEQQQQIAALQTANTALRTRLGRIEQALKNRRASMRRHRS